MTSLPPLLHSPEEFPRLSEEDCIAIQNTLAPYVLQRNTFWEEMPRTAAGVDLAYWRQGEEEAAAGKTSRAAVMTAARKTERARFIGVVLLIGCPPLGKRSQAAFRAPGS